MAFYRIALAAIGAAVGASSVAHAQSTDWANRISVNGDIRYRVQRDINSNGNAASTVDKTSDNLYQRIRARLGVNGKVNDSMMLNFRLSTSPFGNTQNQNSAKSSATQSDVAAMNAKGFFGLDLAYLDYKLAEGFNVQVGRMPNLFWTAGKNEMVWNNIWSHQGVQAKWWSDMGTLRPFVTLNYSEIADRVNGVALAPDLTNGADIALLGGQLGVAWKSDPMWATVAVSTYQYNNIKDFSTGAIPGLAPSTTALGNSTYNNGANYAADYKLLTAGVEVGYTLGFAPVSVYYEYANNTGDYVDASLYKGPTDQKTAMIAGFKIGNLTAPGSWFVGYNYRNVQKDAVFGYAGESGFIGGGTDVLGSQLQLGYQAWQNAAIGVTYEDGLKTISSTAQNYKDYYFDLVANF